MHATLLGTLITPCTDDLLVFAITYKKIKATWASSVDTASFKECHIGLIEASRLKSTSYCIEYWITVTTSHKFVTI